MIRAKLLKPVIFMPPAAKVKCLKKEIYRASTGSTVLVLEKDLPAVRIMFKGFTNWVHESYLAQK